MTKTKIAVSAGAAIAIVLHLVFPEIQLDLATIVLLVIGVAPWLAPLFKSVELPGGVKIELQDVQRATSQVAAAGDVERGNEDQSPSVEPGTADLRGSQSGFEERINSLVSLADQDPNLALVGLRIEIERMLRNVARGHDLSSESRSASQLLRQLDRAQVFPQELVSGLRDLIDFGNQAAHGATVSNDAAAWAISSAPQILHALTGYLGD